MPRIYIMEIIDFDMYKMFVKVRILMDENPTKAKQMLTNKIQKYEKLNFGGELALQKSSDTPK